MHSIYEYNDYCQYLNDYFQEYLRQSTLNSMNTFAELISIAPSTLSRILNRKRGLSIELAEKIGASIGLKKRRLEYFILMVKMAKEKSTGSQISVRNKLEVLKNLNRKTIGVDQYLIFDKWYLLPLRELIRMSSVNSTTDCLRISRMFKPPVTECQVQKGIQLLIDLNLATIDENGNVRITDNVVSTGDYWDNLLVHNYQKEMATIAVESIDTIPRKECDFSTLTLSLSQNGFAKMKKIIKEYRNQMLEIEDSDEGLESKNIYHINIHFFPICKSNEE